MFGQTSSASILLRKGAQLDAFGRFRISSPHTVIDSINEYDISPLFFETILAGAGTVTHVPNESGTKLLVGMTSGDSAALQSRQYNRYIPGKSQLILASSVLGIPKANVRQRLGYFDSKNGLYFECDGATFGVVVRSFTSGSVVNTRVPQSAFNMDKVDGTGASGVILDLSKDNIFVIDFQWLGSGIVHFGMYSPAGDIVYFHQFQHANVNQVAYMTTANLPVRAEITNTGTSSSETVVKTTCFSVITEDSSELATGITASTPVGTTVTQVTTRRNVLSIRPKTTFNSIVNRGSIRDLYFEILTKTNDIFYEVIYNGALGGSPSFASAGASSITEYDTAGTTVTGGILLLSGYAVAGQGSSGGKTTTSLLSKLPIVLDAAGGSPINVSIVCTALSGTASVSATMNWLEVY
mgnify:CR=1 FL=1